jgi:hypothetical protein
MRVEEIGVISSLRCQYEPRALIRNHLLTNFVAIGTTGSRVSCSARDEPLDVLKRELCELLIVGGRHNMDPYTMAVAGPSGDRAAAH